MCESILCFPFCQRAVRLSYFFALFSEKYRILRAVGRVGSVLVAEKKKRSKHRKSYAEWDAGRKGKSWKAKLKAAIDAVIPQAKDFDDFLRLMAAQGYEI